MKSSAPKGEDPSRPFPSSRPSEGLPKGPYGRIGVAASGAKSGRVWALVEAGDGGLFRSDDGGKTWKKVTDDRNIRQRPWYCTYVYADPREPDTVYALNVGMWRSRDGGKTFDPIRAPHGDHHDLWIHPSDPQVMVNGNDGGANVSYNGGLSWSSQLNQPTAEFYRAATSASFPYRIYGCQQDNTCVSIASRTEGAGIGLQDWYVIGGGESGHVDRWTPTPTMTGSTTATRSTRTAPIHSSKTRTVTDSPTAMRSIPTAPIQSSETATVTGSTTA